MFARDTEKAYEQGHLDSLCGIYAALNAVRSCLPFRTMKDGDYEWLFAMCVNAMLSEPKYHKSFTTGIGTPLLLRLLSLIEAAISREYGIEITHRRPFHPAAKLPANQAVAHLAAHLKCDFTAAVCAMTFGVSHWTVVTEIENGWMQLADSVGFRRFRLSKLSFRKKAPNSKMVAMPPVGMIFMQFIPAKF